MKITCKYHVWQNVGKKDLLSSSSPTISFPMINSSNSKCAALLRFTEIKLMATCALVLILQCSTQAMTTYRTLHISSTPTGASITMNGVLTGNSPLILKDYPFDKDSVLKVEASLAGYESKTNIMTRKDADAIQRQYKDEPGMPISFELQPLQQKISVRLEAGNGSKFFVDGSPVDSDTVLTFKRDSSSSPWQSITVRAERDNYQSANNTITKEEAAALPVSGDKRKMQFNLVEIRRTVALQVAANVNDVQVMVNDTNKISTGLNAPASLTLEFYRQDNTQPWSKNVIKLIKDGFEYRPPAPAEAQPDFTTNLTLDFAENLHGKLTAMNFQPLRQLPAPWLRVIVDHGEVRLDVTNVMSAISPEGTMNPFDRSFVNDDELFIADRFGTVPASQDPQDSQGNDKPLSVVIAVAKRIIRDEAPAEVIGSEIVKVYPPPAKIHEHLTSIGALQGTYDLQPCITSDGKYLYFSSNRGDDGQYHIFRKPTNASLRLEEISHPQPGIDMEPTVFTDNNGKARLAFTRYPVKSAIHAEPHIMVQTSEGGFAQVGDPGHSPVWSDDGIHIAYVSMKGKICIMTPEDGNSVELESGTATAPAWLPGNKQIVFAKPNGNSFGLTIIDVEGSNGVNPISDTTSFYSYPTVSYHDKKIYFISNRQIRQRGDPKCWGIYYIDWKQ